MTKPLHPAIAIFLCCLLGACVSQPKTGTHVPLSNSGYLPAADLEVEIPSLSNCTYPEDKSLHLNSHEPVTIIVHGCFSSAGQFRHLADVFAFHGQQTICFNYDDRDRLTKGSADLITAIEELREDLPKQEITVIGHSQGGLLARRAFISERADRLEAASTGIRLVTISAPFGGIQAASHCGSKTLAWLSLGATKLICQLVTGSKYHEIPPNSVFINNPGSLIPAVQGHLSIATDELGSCRRHNDRGKCVEDDYVFSLVEQTQQAIQQDKRLSSMVVKAGHVEIVGDGDNAPTQLIAILQQQGLMSPTPSEKRRELAQLLTNLYLSNTR